MLPPRLQAVPTYRASALLPRKSLRRRRSALDAAL